ncbi:Alpha-mannosidase [Rhynchospora pubera]|uniref:Alpha-mannosidase n=1 Tax=Rhynchospora pubera TaxID=906938 RepID=A0AAV8GNB7_9POAL|nr:Alpha-mannosidase [Rhynchospora pubera]
MGQTILWLTLVVLCFTGSVRTSAGAYIRYNTTAGPVAGKLNVYLVPHSHDDVGWLKTIDQYYVGSNNSIGASCVLNILDSVVEGLLRNPDRKFVFAEQAFFQRWWEEQSETTQSIVKQLVNSGQLEFINGGWCMHDEATTHYTDLIDQTTLGHRLIKKQFGKVPRVGWQIDPFGHSAVQGYLLGAELGFDSMQFARIDYQDREKRKADKTLQVIWRGSKTFGSSSQIFANAFPVHYGPPDGFGFEIFDDIIPVQDDQLLFDYNVDQRVNDFVDAALTQANVTRTNHIMWTMGQDFKYQYAESWFKNMDKLIHYVNKDGRVNAFYSTPSIYIDMLNSLEESWPLKYDDYFPYAIKPYSYWTGYFTSRPAFKRYVRDLSGYYLAARQLIFMMGSTSDDYTPSLGDALGVAQHHDAVSGTSRQHTTNDYAKRLSIGASKAAEGINVALTCLTYGSKASSSSAAKLSQCNLLNISYCPTTEQDISSNKTLVIVAYNPLGWHRTDIIRIPVNDDQLLVKDSSGAFVETQFVEIDNITLNLRKFYVEAYLGSSPEQTPKYWLIFQASAPPLGWNSYYISRQTAKVHAKGRYVAQLTNLEVDTIEVGPGPLKMTFSSSGQLQSMTNNITGVNLPVQQNYLWYNSNPGDALNSQTSGAYVFRPNGTLAISASSLVGSKIKRGPLVDEVYQQFNSWISQVTRLYKERDYAEVEFTIGPIPIEDGVGKEVISRLTTNMVTNGTFYTDSNGRDFLKRVRDYRDDWDLNVTEPIAGNYYPVNLGVYILDENSELSILVDHAVGASSIGDGQIEVMLHRRMVAEDHTSASLKETLNEEVCVNKNCEGLVIRGNYYIGINKLGNGSYWRRITGQQIYSPFLLAFSYEDDDSWDSSHVPKCTLMDENYSLPPNVALITLQILDDGNVLLRLAHLFEAGEDANYSTMASVELKKVFSQRSIKEITETSLSTNQVKSEMKRMNWKTEGKDKYASSPIRGGPVDSEALVVELGPMEIRTFLLKF